MHKKLLSMVLSVALLSLMLVAGATTALAAPPTDTQNFLPDDTANSALVGGPGLGDVLSDKFDGTDRLAHLTNVSTTDTAEVRWFACPDSRFSGTGQTVTANSQLVGCLSLGTDTAPTTPAGPTGTDEAYELLVDIPADLDTGDNQGVPGVNDIVAAACTNGSAADFEDDVTPAGDERNCTSDVEDNVRTDDANIGVQGDQTSAGEITGFCAQGASRCRLVDSGDADTTPDPDPAIDARFTPLPHGSNAPDGNFTIRASTSIDVLELSGIPSLGDAVTDPNLGYDGTFCVQLTATADSKTWQCDVTLNVSSENEVAIFDQGGTTGNGYCAGSINCKLDSHYVVAQARVIQSATVSFARQGASSTDRDISLTAGCDSPDTEDTNRTFDDSHIVGCLTDQFGAPLTGPVTFESAGVGEFVAGFDCTAADENDDGFAEDCHGAAPGADGEYDTEILSEVAGDQTVTFCFDPEAAPAATDHGCADETVKATLVKHWQGFPDNVTLVFDDGDGDCQGITNKNNQVGDQDLLIACVTDDNGDPISTLEADNGSLQWFIEQGADDFTDTRFSTSPPQETDASGEADATLEAVDPGTDNIRVELLDEDGDFVDSAIVQKQVEPRRRAGTTISIRHRKHPHRFQGRVRSSDASCVSGRTVVLKRVRRGPDRRIGTDVTNARGKYRIRHRKTRVAKRYYTKVRGTSTCGGKRSRTLRRR